MSASKTKKKVALVKAVCHALELIPTLKDNQNLQSVLALTENAKKDLEEENIDGARKTCSDCLNAIREIIKTLTPTKLRKALDRQLDKIDKY